MQATAYPWCCTLAKFSALVRVDLRDAAWKHAAARYVHFVERPVPVSWTYDPFKRLVDIAVSAAGLVVLAPVLLALWVGVRGALGRPALFRQQRTGKGGSCFTILKFRTMVERRTDAAPINDDDESARIPPFGKLLRTTGLDELPQLWNILRGDMSLVGPRPLLPQYEALYTPEQARRHTVRPGLTGWAQIKGRVDIAWARQFELDAWYIDNRSFLLDLRILLLSVFVLLRQFGRGDRAAKVQRLAFTGTPADKASSDERTASRRPNRP